LVSRLRGLERKSELGIVAFPDEVILLRLVLDAVAARPSAELFIRVSPLRIVGLN